MRRASAYLSILAGLFVVFATPAVRAFIITSTDPDPWLSTATGSRSGNGIAATITWSIVPDGTTTVRDTNSSASAPSNLVAFMNANFGGSGAQSNLALQPWFHFFTDSFSRWSQLGGVDFAFESHDDGVFHPSASGVLGVRGDIRIAGTNVDGAGNALAFTYLPPSGGDMVIDTADGSFFTNATSNFINLRNTLLHEIGHTFGMQHVSTSSALLMEPVIDTSFDGPQLDEVRAVHYYFGDVNEKSYGGFGNNVAARATDLGALSSGQTTTIGAAANVPSQAISSTATDFISISNFGDKDFYSITVNGPSTLNATLTPRGGVFDQAPQATLPTTFNANARNNLLLAVLGVDGATVMSQVNASPSGGIEAITNLLLPAAGTYFLHVSGDDDNIQLYELSVTANAVLLGDYNRDGMVDAADYSLWRKTQGQSVAQGSGADGNFDGQVTPADYSVWRSHFGQTTGAASPPGSAIPEPSAGVFAISAIVFSSSVGPRRRRLHR